MKKKIKKRYIFLIGILLVAIYFWIACFSPIFPIALNDNLDEIKNYKMVDYDINRSIRLAKEINNSDKIGGILHDKTQDVDNEYFTSNYNNGSDYNNMEMSNNGILKKDDEFRYYFSMYDPKIMMYENGVEKTFDYNIKNINQDNLEDYNIFNVIDEEYYKEKLYYNWDRFKTKAKIIKQKNNTFIFYPVEYYGFSIGPDPEKSLPMSFFNKYGQNILICQDDTIIQVKISADNKENLMQENADFINTLLTEFYKANKYKDYKFKFEGYE